ncbi:MAG: ABC transporter ATP-binding protein [Candidatus Saccharibacteria bacterium]|nr:ABC transporter ATP-binding protein [Candidatus Saccharibacteria bacterium]
MDNQLTKQKLIKIILKIYNNNLDQINADLQLTLKQTIPLNRTEPRFIPPTDAKPLVSVNNLTRVYRNGKEKVTAVNNVSFDIYQGEIVALTGTSGSGKSTLLHMIGGLDKPTSGQVIIDGVNIAKLSDAKLSNFRNRTIGFVFQFFYLQPFLTLAQNIAVSSMIFSMSNKERKARTEELAKAVGLSERLKHLPKELSGGQMQRAAIARALFNQPKILIADEPTGNLDSANTNAILDLFHKVRKEYNTTIIIVTHDENIAQLADRRLTIHDGELI